MSRVTKFAGRDPGPAARMAGFIAHLRENGLRLGVSETEASLGALTHVDAASPNLTRAALKAVCAGCKDEAQRFDALFDAYQTIRVANWLGFVSSDTATRKTKY